MKGKKEVSCKYFKQNISYLIVELIKIILNCIAKKL